MQADFFDYTDAVNIIRKNIDTDHPLASVQSLTPYRPLSDLTGEIDLSYTDTIYAANYCRLNFGTTESPRYKYYYITDRQTLPGRKLALVLRCDVLKTYETPIMSLTVWCKRSAVLQTKYIMDRLAPVSAKREVSGQETNGTASIGAHSNEMILITVG